jgi:YidC/Oxa1 family membrane protein insertase
MDKRTLLALVLTAIVIVATPLLFPSARTPQRRIDSAAIGATSHAAPGAPTATAPTRASGAATRATSVTSAPTATSAISPETTLVTTNRAEYRLTSPGGVPSTVRLPEYRSLTAGASTDRVELVDTTDRRLFSLQLISGRDTLSLDTVSFKASAPKTEGAYVVTTLTSVGTPTPVSLTYRFPRDSFAFSVSASFAAAAGPAPRSVLVVLPSRVRSQESNVPDDTRHLAFGYKNATRDAQSVLFTQLDAATTRVDSGSIRWFAERNKYFVVAVIPTAPDTAFDAILMRGAPRVNKEATAASGAALLRLAPGQTTFSLRIYAGPQTWQTLRRTAPDLENVNPVGGWLHAVVQPFATIMMRLLLWMRRTLNVEYGWVLIILGAMARIVFWPLNQTAMRSQIQMQRMQPEINDVQKRFRNDPERQREAMMKLYADHGMSPFSPLLGCLPILLQMPILFALFYVLQNTIELRGVPFWWMPDLSARDPLFITPLVMGVSMFFVSWIGMRNAPPNPQAKMMGYVMPVVFTALFWKFASGLNLYYAMGNLVALPQQWIIARERAASLAAPAKSTASRPQGTGRERS